MSRSFESDLWEHAGAWLEYVKESITSLELIFIVNDRGLHNNSN